MGYCHSRTKMHISDKATTHRCAEFLADTCDNFFFVNHYGQPDPLDDESTWRVDIGGLVAHPQSLTLADLKARERREVDFTMQCSGNTGTCLDFFIGGIGNARWGVRSWARC